MKVDEFHPICVHGVSLEAKCPDCDKENSRGLFDHVDAWIAHKRVVKEVRWAAVIVLAASLLVLILLTVV